MPHPQTNGRAQTWCRTTGCCSSLKVFRQYLSLRPLGKGHLWFYSIRQLYSPHGIHPTTITHGQPRANTPWNNNAKNYFCLPHSLSPSSTRHPTSITLLGFGTAGYRQPNSTSRHHCHSSRSTGAAHPNDYLPPFTGSHASWSGSVTSS